MDTRYANYFILLEMMLEVQEALWLMVVNWEWVDDQRKAKEEVWNKKSLMMIGGPQWAKKIADFII